MQGRTPLAAAATAETVHELLSNGADIADKDEHVVCSLSSKLTAHWQTQHHSPMCQYMLHRHTCIYTCDLARKGCDHMCVGMQGSTPLHAAAARGHLDVLKALIERGAHVHTIDLKVICNLGSALAHPVKLVVICG